MSINRKTRWDLRQHIVSLSTEKVERMYLRKIYLNNLIFLKKRISLLNFHYLLSVVLVLYTHKTKKKHFCNVNYYFLLKYFQIMFNFKWIVKKKVYQTMLFKENISTVCFQIRFRVDKWHYRISIFDFLKHILLPCFNNVLN